MGARAGTMSALTNARGRSAQAVYATWLLTLILTSNSRLTAAQNFLQSHYFITTRAHWPPGTHVLSVQAQDQDSDGPITYAIQNTPETFSYWFEINSVTGKIFTCSILDCETDNDVSLKVSASDFGQLSLTLTVDVYIHIIAQINRGNRDVEYDPEQHLVAFSGSPPPCVVLCTLVIIMIVTWVESYGLYDPLM